jgi:endonuclease/exonuclease/phosphatase family metal-dependent hydrolase
MTYNILLGAPGREQRVIDVIDRWDPDVLALQEVTDLALVRRLARLRDLTLMVGKPSDPGEVRHNAVLSRLPVHAWHNHRHPGTMLRSHLEVALEAGNGVVGGVFRVHCLHLAARFGERAHGESRRLRELDAVDGDLGRMEAVPHLMVGDFNSVSPGDTVAATRFIWKMHALRRAGLLVQGEDGLWGPSERTPGGADGDRERLWHEAGVDPRLEIGMPRLPGILFAVTRGVPRGHAVDRLVGRFIERWSVERMLAAGYADCYRLLHPRAPGYTCATWVPAARIDYIFASPAMASQIETCDVVGSRSLPDPGVLTASDHHPVVADFRL